MDTNSDPKILETNKIYFPNLNGVRFIAALMVIIQHTEEAKIKIGFPTSFSKDSDLGELGVTLFFVLSGFLITYLLHSEKLSSGNISLQNFYTRRILRIWPLYFLIIILGFWIIPDFIPVLRDAVGSGGLSANYSTQLLLDIFFMPNVAIILFPPILYVSQIWSIGVEEQFYLIWPLIMKYFNNSLKPLIAIIIFFICSRALTLLIFTSLLRDFNTSPDLLAALVFLRRILGLTRIDCMAVGGIGAWILFNQKHKILDMLYSKSAQVVTYLSVIVLMTNLMHFKYERHFLFSILFTIIILNLSSNKRSIITLNNSIFNYLGKISYSVYMFHAIAVSLSIELLLKYYVPDPNIFSYNVMLLFANLFLYSSVICLVTAISMLSYTYFEKYFLAKKIKFSTIISGDSVDTDVDNERAMINIAPLLSK